LSIKKAHISFTRTLWGGGSAFLGFFFFSVLDTIFLEKAVQNFVFLSKKVEKTFFDYLENHKTAGRRFFYLFDIFTKSLEK